MYLDRDKFKHMMGFLDTSSSILILNRVYDSIAERPDGITFMEFVTYLNALLNGNQDDKAELCFKMIDTKKKGFLVRDDFTTLISGAMIANQEHGAKPDIVYKAELTANMMYQKLGKGPGETVSLSEFKASLLKDPSLLDNLSLLSKGVTESLVTGSEEETRLKWYLNQAKFIVICVKAIIREIDHPTILLGQKVHQSPIKGTQQGQLHTASHADGLNTLKAKFSSDFVKTPNKNPVSDHRIVIRKRSPEVKKDSPLQSSGNQIDLVVNNFEVNDYIDDLVKKDEVSVKEMLPQGVPPASEMIDEEIQISDLKVRKPLLGPLEIPKLNHISKKSGSNQLITPSFAPVRPKDAQDFSFAMNFPSGDRLPSSRNIHDEIWMPEIPEEGSILTLNKDHVIDIIQERNQSFNKLKEVLSNLSSQINQKDAKVPRLKNVKFGQSQGLLRLQNANSDDDEMSPILRKAHTPENQGGFGGSALPKFKTLKTEGLNDTISSYNEGLQFTERGHFFQLKKKMEEILRFSEEIVHKLAEEMSEKEKEKQGIMQKKMLLKATTNIPQIEEPPSDGPVVFVFHKRWNLVINIMIGINKATRALWDIEEHTLSKADYKMRDKYELSFKRSITENLNSRETISFYSFAPYVFAEIRKLYKIDSESFLNSIGADSLINNLIRGEVKAYRELFSTGKSGSFFFYSVDGKYVIKTLRADEYDFLKSILIDYHNHLIHHPKTLIPKFFGMHELIYNKRGWKGCGCRPSQHLYLVIMDNIFVTDRPIQRRFDLKGSTYKRTVGDEKLMDSHSKKIALKDLDFLKLGIKVQVDKKTRDQVMN
jgi:hypothetical protein